MAPCQLLPTSRYVVNIIMVNIIMVNSLIATLLLMIHITKVEVGLKVVNIIIVNINILIAILLLLIHLTKVEVGPDAHRVRAECRALDDQLGEKRSQWRVSR